MSVKLRKKKTKKGESLYLDIYNDGQRNYEFLKIYLTKNKKANKEKMKIGETIRAKRELEILTGSHGLVPIFKRRSNFVDYFENLVRGKKSTNYTNTLNHLKKFTGGTIKFLQINGKWVDDFKLYLLQKVNKNSAHVYFTTFKTVLEKAVKERIINENPAKYTDKIKTNDVERVYLTHEQLTQLSRAKCPNDEVKKAFLFACYTGLRFSDLKKITWDKIQQENGRLKIQYRQKKTGGFEYFPLSPTAQKILNGKIKTSINSNKPIFKLSSNAYYNYILKQWAKNAEIKKNISSHTARHTFATLALTNNVDLFTVAKLLGHKDIATTQIYAKIIDKKKDEAVDMLPALEL